MKLFFKISTGISGAFLATIALIYLYSTLLIGKKTGWDGLADFLGGAIICTMIGIFFGIYVARLLHGKKLQWAALIGTAITLVILFGIQRKINNEVNSSKNHSPKREVTKPVDLD